jgi:hypothetical protein
MQYIFECLNPECKNYGKQFEVYAKIGTLIIKDIICPDCRTHLIKRKWFSTPVHYHGEGFTKESKNDT